MIPQKVRVTARAIRPQTVVAFIHVLSETERDPQSAQGGFANRTSIAKEADRNLKSLKRAARRRWRGGATLCGRRRSGLRPRGNPGEKAFLRKRRADAFRSV